MCVCVNVRFVGVSILFLRSGCRFLLYSFPLLLLLLVVVVLERHILEARIDGRRGRGRPTRRWEQDINDWMDMTTTQAGRLAEDRILFRQKVQEATSRQEIS